MSKTNYLQAVISDLQRTAGPYKCAMCGRVRRETGGRQTVRVRHGEGVASYTGPESCACGREAASEALTGECVG